MDRSKRWIITFGETGAEGRNVISLRAPEEMPDRDLPVTKGSEVLLVHGEAGPEYLAAARWLKEQYGAGRVTDWFRKDDWTPYESTVCDALLLSSFREENQFLKIPLGRVSVLLQENPTDTFVLGYARTFPESLWRTEQQITAISERSWDIPLMIRDYLAKKLSFSPGGRKPAGIPENFPESEAEALFPLPSFGSSGITWENSFSRKKTRDPDQEMEAYLDDAASRTDELDRVLSDAVGTLLDRITLEAVQELGYDGAAAFLLEEIAPGAAALKERFREEERRLRHEERLRSDKLRNARHYAADAPLERGVRSSAAAEYAAALDALCEVRRQQLLSEPCRKAAEHLEEAASERADSLKKGAAAAAALRKETERAGGARPAGAVSLADILSGENLPDGLAPGDLVISSEADIRKLGDRLLRTHYDRIKAFVLRQAGDDAPSKRERLAPSSSGQAEPEPVLREKDGILQKTVWYALSYRGRYRSSYMAEHTVTEDMLRAGMRKQLFRYFEDGVLTADRDGTVLVTAEAAALLKGVDGAPEQGREKLCGPTDISGLTAFLLEHPGTAEKLEKADMRIRYKDGQHHAE